MNTEQERAAFEAWGESIGFCVTGKYAETVDVLCAESAFKAGYKAGRAALAAQPAAPAAPAAQWEPSAWHQGFAEMFGGGDVR